MTHEQKIVVLIGVVIGTIAVLWGWKGVPSAFTFWPDKE